MVTNLSERAYSAYRVLLLFWLRHGENSINFSNQILKGLCKINVLFCTYIIIIIYSIVITTTIIITIIMIMIIIILIIIINMIITSQEALLTILVSRDTQVAHC